MFMQKERTRMHEQKKTENPHSEYVQRKSLCQLVYKKLEDIGTITVKQYQEVLKKYPLSSELYALTTGFCNVIFSKNSEKSDEWINVAQKYDIPELQTFINGIKKDLTAVKNGITYSYNNGLAERRGRKRLRYALYEAAISVIGKNKEFKEIHHYYRTREKNPLKKMQSVIAVACKLIRNILYDTDKRHRL